MQNNAYKKRRTAEKDVFNSPSFLYNRLMTNQTIHTDYTSSGHVYQLQIPIDIADWIPANDSVRLLDAVLERMDYTQLYAAYASFGRNGFSPKKLFKILVYGYMNQIYSTRKLEQACKRDINFIYLLGGTNAPDHTTLARFRSKRLTSAIEGLFNQFIVQLAAEKELSLETVFIDGTKLEANANRYTFVWKKSLLKNEAKMQEKMKTNLPQIAQTFGIKFHVEAEITVHRLKRLYKQLKRLQQQQGLVFVHGKGTRKKPLQRAIEETETYLSRLKTYNAQKHILGERNSFSKTDHEATFMRMKEDHMRNGQLKPGYNVTIAVDSEYMLAIRACEERSDMQTFIPIMESIKDLGYSKPVADAGFESEENYSWCEANGQLAFIKPANYEQNKKKKYRTDIGRKENMHYDAQKDSYTCHMGHPIEASGEKKVKSKSGYTKEITQYSCSHCQGCPHKEKCIKGRSKTPLEERSKNMEVSKKFLRQRKEMEERIKSEEGIILRVNRSIQVEGAFGIVKQDMSYRRFLLRGQVKIQTELYLLGLAYNINKLHNKRQKQRSGKHLHEIAAA